MSQIITKPKDGKFKGSCSFFGADKCNDKQCEKASDCIIFQLIEDVQGL